MYQFASPVRWIETQDIPFTQYKFEHLIEVGPSPTLMDMATHTLKAKYEDSDDAITHSCAILCHAKHYQFQDELEEAPAA